MLNEKTVPKGSDPNGTIFILKKKTYICSITQKEKNYGGLQISIRRAAASPCSGGQTA
jgi:hypothetical protein